MDRPEGDFSRCCVQKLILIVDVLTFSYLMVFFSYLRGRPSRSKRAKTRQSEQGQQGVLQGREGTANQSNSDSEAPGRSGGLRWPGAEDDKESFDGNSGEEHDQGEGHKGRGCRCGRTKCLKQYCQCFRNDIRCTPECLCSNCHNDGRHEEVRMSAVRHIRMNNSSAFKGTALEITNLEVRTPRGSVHTVRGCRCRRSKCQKKYCECFSAGLHCTNNCVCVDCANGNTLSSPADEISAQTARVVQQAKVKANPAVSAAVAAPATRRQKDTATAGPEGSWGQGTAISGDQTSAPDGTVAKGGEGGACGNSYFQRPNGHGGQPVASDQQIINGRPSSGFTSNIGTRSAVSASNFPANVPVSTTGPRRKPAISVQVPVAAFSKGAVIPLSGPASSGSAGPAGSSVADPAEDMVRFDEGATPSMGDQLQTPKSEFAGLIGSGGQLSRASESFSFGWKGQSPYYTSGMTPAAPLSASGVTGSDWSPREGLRSRRSATTAGLGSAGGPNRFPVPTFPSSIGGGGGSNSGTGGFGFGTGGDGGSASAGLNFGGGSTPFGTGLTPLCGGDSPAAYTRSRSGNLASMLLHRNTPPTSPGTWGGDNLPEPFQDPDGVLPAPLSGRAWMHRDML
jgi:hypothetical protein